MADASGARHTLAFWSASLLRRFSDGQDLQQPRSMLAENFCSRHSDHPAPL